MAGDFYVVVDPYLCKRLRNDDFIYTKFFADILISNESSSRVTCNNFLFIIIYVSNECSGKI